MKYNFKLNYYIYHLFVAAFLFTVVVGEPCDHEELLRCAYPLRVLTAGNAELGFAAKKEELVQLCPDLSKGLLCIDSYTRRCMTADMRGHFNRLYSGTKMVIEDLCQEGPYQEEFLRHAPCMRLVKSEYDDCATHYTQMIQDVNNPARNNGSNPEAEGNAQMRTVCCSFQDYLTCSENIVMKQCGETTAKFTQEFLDRMSSSLIKDHCRLYLPLCMDAISGAFNSSALHLSNWALLLFVSLLVMVATTHRLT